MPRLWGTEEALSATMTPSSESWQRQKRKKKKKKVEKQPAIPQLIAGRPSFRPPFDAGRAMAERLYLEEGKKVPLSRRIGWAVTGPRARAFTKAGVWTVLTRGAYPVISGIKGILESGTDFSVMDRIGKGVFYPEHTKELYEKVPGSERLPIWGKILAGITENVLLYGAVGVGKGAIKSRLFARKAAKDIERASEIAAKDLIKQKGGAVYEPLAGQGPGIVGRVKPPKFAKLEQDVLKDRFVNEYYSKLSAVDTASLKTGFQETYKQTSLTRLIGEELQKRGVSVGLSIKPVIGQSYTLVQGGKQLAGKILEIVGNEVKMELSSGKIIAATAEQLIPLETKVSTRERMKQERAKKLPEKISLDLAGSAKIEQLKQAVIIPKKVNQQEFKQWIIDARAGDNEAWGKIYKYREVSPKQFEKQLRNAVKGSKKGQSVDEILNMVKPVKEIVGRPAGVEGAIEAYKGEPEYKIEIDPRTGEAVEYGPTEFQVELSVGKIETPPYSMGYGEANIYVFDIDNPKTWIKPEKLQTSDDVDKLLDSISERVLTERLPQVRDKLADIKDKLMEYRDEKFLEESGIDVARLVKPLKEVKPRGIRKEDPNFYNWLQKNPLSLEEVKGRTDLEAKQDLVDSLEGNKGRRIINKKGKNIDKLAQNAQQEGFITPEDLEQKPLIDAFINKVVRSLQGEKIYTPGQVEKQAEKARDAEWIDWLKKNVMPERTKRITDFKNVLMEESENLRLASSAKLSQMIREAEDRLKLLRTFTRMERNTLGLPKADYWDNQIKNLLKPYKEKLKKFLREESTKAVYEERKAAIMEKWYKPLIESGRMTARDFYEAVTRTVARTGNDFNHLGAEDEEVLVSELTKGVLKAEFNRELDAVMGSEIGAKIKELQLLEIKERVKIRKTKEKAAAKEEIKERQRRGEAPIEGMVFFAPEGYKINLLDDTRRVFADLQRLSGQPIHHLYEEMINRKHLLAERERVKWEKKYEGLPIEKFIQYDWKLIQKVMNRELPEETLVGDKYSSHREVIQFFREFYKEFEPRVMVMRIKDFMFTGKKALPKNMPKEVMDEAVNIYLFQGKQALEDWVAQQLTQGDRWGLREAYTPNSIFLPQISKEYDIGWSSMGKSGIKTKTAIDYADEKTVDQRFHAYLRQMTALWHMQDGLYMVEDMWSKMANRFGNKRAIEEGLNDVFKTMKGITETPTILEKSYIAVARAVYSAVFAHPYLLARNLHQNIAFYPNQVALMEFVTKEIAVQVSGGQSKTMTLERTDYFNKYLPQDLKRHLFELGKSMYERTGDVRDVYRALRDYVGTFYGHTDTLNRYIAFGTKMMELDNFFTKNPVNPDTLLEQSYFKGSTIEERMHALYLAERDGVEAYKRYIAERMVSNIHWMYDRAQRSPHEQGSKGRWFGAMLTFMKSRLLVQVREVQNIERYGVTKIGRKAAWNALYQLVIGSAIAGWLVQKVTGVKDNPYHPLRGLQYSPGGILMGAMGNILSITGAIYLAAVAQTEKDRNYALSTLVRKMAGAGRSMIIGWKFTINIVESITGTRNLDQMLLKEARQVFDTDYDYQEWRHKIDRTLKERFQHGFFGQRPAELRIDLYKEEERKKIKKRNRLRRTQRQLKMKQAPKIKPKYKGYARRKRK